VRRLYSPPMPSVGRSSPGVRDRFPPTRGFLLAAHVFLALSLGGLTGVAAWRLLAFPPDPAGAVSLAVIVAGLLLLPAVVYRLIFLLTAYYEIDPASSLTIRFGAWHEVVPIEEVEEIRSGGRVPASLRRDAPGWLEMWHGKSSDAEEGTVDWMATDRGSGLLLLVTKQRRLAISPADPTGFARRLADLSAHGSLGKIEPFSIQPPAEIVEILKNPASFGLLLVGLIGILSLGVFLTWIQPGLPPSQPFRFDPSGGPTSLGSPARLLILPLAGGFVWLLNGLIGWWAWRKGQRPSAFALWGVSLIVALGLWVAVLTLLSAG
jgi:hypothetical protein